MLQENYNGVLLFNKNCGKTSFQSVNELKKILKVKKIGHAVKWKAAAS